jgi:RimJ/RimL family protein N-acetyltransferase
MNGLLFRPIAETDLPLLERWLGRVHVQEWWRDPSAPEHVAEKYRPCIRGTEKTDVFIMTSDDTAIGMIQSYRIEDHPGWAAAIRPSGLHFPAAAGIDYLLGEPNLIGRGIGTAAIGAFTQLVFDRYTDVDCIVVTPQAANHRSCRVLEKNGYTCEWIGHLDSNDPGDRDTAALYIKRRDER